jgi:hypothetical protein
MAINSRKKGAKNEREIAKTLELWSGKKFAKTPASGGLNWKTSNVAGDVVCTDEKVYFPFCIEGKSYLKIDFSHLLVPNIKRIDILDFWTQCKRDADKCEKIPLLMVRYNGIPKYFWFTAVEYDFFNFLIKPFYTNSQKYIEYQDGENHLVIFPSTWLFSLKYNRLKLAFKNYARNQKEIIKPLPINKDYKISNRGYLISPNGKIINGSINGSGLKICVVITNGKRKTITLYRWVAKVFVKNPKNKPVVNHILPHKDIVDARNLEWVTYTENSQHYFDNVDYGYTIEKINPKTGEIMGIYNSPLLAAKSVGKNSGSAITKAILGKRKTAYGLIWKKLTIKK